MGRKAALFPGQGAQKVGMGKAICEKHPAAREIFERAGEALGYDIASICFDGPEEKLKITETQQPAILTVSMAAVEAWRADGGDTEAIEAAAGLSLGEYTALTYAGAVDFDDAVRLVQKRGRYMHEAARSHPGAMASIIGLPADGLAPLVEQASRTGIIVAANFNSPGQTVVSGVSEAVDALCGLASEAGAKRCIKLKVSGAFHSPLMQDASEKLADELAKVEFRRPRIPVIANVTARPVEDPDDIRSSLVKQLTHPVRWVQSMQGLLADGYDSFVEIGPGKVLAGLMRRAGRSAAVENYTA